MNYYKTATAIVTIFLLAGCVSPHPPPEPLGSNSSMIAISVTNRAPIRLFKNSPDRVYFVRLEEGDSPNTATKLVTSNYSKGDYIYLLNAQPGRYAAVSSLRVQKNINTRRSQHTVYYAEDLIEMTQVTVTPGSVNFIGDYTIDTDEFKDPEPAQLHYYRLIEPGAENRRGLLSLFVGELEITYRGSLHEVKRDADSQAKFLTAANKHFVETGWSDIINGR